YVGWRGNGRERITWRTATPLTRSLVFEMAPWGCGIASDTRLREPARDEAAARHAPRRKVCDDRGTTRGTLHTLARRRRRGACARRHDDAGSDGDDGGRAGAYARRTARRVVAQRPKRIP